MSLRRMAFAALSAAAMIAAAPVAFAGDRDGYGGYDGPPPAPGHCQEVHLSDSFFYDQGGVGPAYDDYASGGGGGIVETGANAGASASAFASASASAKVSVGFRGQFHGNVRPPRPVNCRSGGGKRW